MSKKDQNTEASPELRKALSKLIQEQFNKLSPEKRADLRGAFVQVTAHEAGSMINDGTKVANIMRNDVVEAIQGIEAGIEEKYGRGADQASGLAMGAYAYMLNQMFRIVLSAILSTVDAKRTRDIFGEEGAEEFIAETTKELLGKWIESMLEQANELTHEKLLERDSEIRQTIREFITKDEKEESDD